MLALLFVPVRVLVPNDELFSNSELLDEAIEELVARGFSPITWLWTTGPGNYSYWPLAVLFGLVAVACLAGAFLPSPARPIVLLSAGAGLLLCHGILLLVITQPADGWALAFSSYAPLLRGSGLACVAMTVGGLAALHRSRAAPLSPLVVAAPAALAAAILTFMAIAAGLWLQESQHPLGAALLATPWWRNLPAPWEWTFPAIRWTALAMMTLCLVIGIGHAFRRSPRAVGVGRVCGLLGLSLLAAGGLAETTYFVVYQYAASPISVRMILGFAYHYISPWLIGAALVVSGYGALWLRDPTGRARRKNRTK